MYKADICSKSTEALATAAIQLGRELCVQLRKTPVGKNSLEVGFVNRCLKRVSDGVIFDRRDDGGLDAVRGILESALEHERLSTHQAFDGFYDPEAGAVGTVREVAVFTRHGDELSSLLDRFNTFLRIRELTRDRIEAERILARMMRD